MAQHRLHTSERATGELERLDSSVARRILKKLRRLAADPDVVKHEALTGQFAGFCRLRVGDYRVIYRILRDQQVIVIHMIGHRKDIYRQ